MLLLRLCLVFGCLFVKCSSQGAPWSEEDTLIIYKKLNMLIKNPGQVLRKYQQLHPGVYNKPYHRNTRPNAPKLLRLGFHDCIPIADSTLGEVSGCDGCLNPDGIGINLLTKYKMYNGQNKQSAPDVTLTNNNGLLQTADILEEIYTNKDFPHNLELPSLSVSMKESGKSRADLWAFAALMAAKVGIEQNNLACQGKNSRSCGALFALEDVCELSWNKVPVFKTGRKDCTPDSSLERAFYTNSPELHPNLHGNGPTIVNWYKNHFGLTARESIALTGGAHSFGKFNAEISLLKYFWTRGQQNMMNNQLFRHIAQRPQYFLDCRGSKGYKLVGDAYGNKAETKWVVTANRFSKNGGPFQWFHRYDRCPASNTCAAIDLGSRSQITKSLANIFLEDRASRVTRFEPPTHDGCCKDLEPGMQCQPWCQRDIQNDETALSSETGFYWKFESDPDTGRPFGCPGFKERRWLLGRKFTVYPKCDKEDYAPEGEPLYAIVDDFADNPQKWMDEFWPALHKMLANGYTATDLTVNSIDLLTA